MSFSDLPSLCVDFGPFWMFKLEQTEKDSPKVSRKKNCVEAQEKLVRSHESHFLWLWSRTWQLASQWHSQESHSSLNFSEIDETNAVIPRCSLILSSIYTQLYWVDSSFVWIFMNCVHQDIFMKKSKSKMCQDWFWWVKTCVYTFIKAMI